MPSPGASRSFDAVVVGAGAIGLACAWELSRRGAVVAVVDRARPPAGATRVAAGMLAPVGELTFGEPELLKLTLEAAARYPEFVTELEAASGEEVGYEETGALHVALDRDEAAELRRVHELQRTLGLEAEWLPPRRCRQLEPGLTPSFNGGVHAPGEASIDPRRLALALASACRAAGVETRFGCEVTEGLFDGERLVGVRTASTARGGGEQDSRAGGKEGEAHADLGEARAGGAGEPQALRADAVVLAAGAWSGQAEWLPPAARPPVRPVKGQALELRARDGEPACARILASERVYLVPRPDGRLIVGATSEEQGFDTAVTAGGVHELLREAYRLLPDVAEMELVEAAAGLRPGTADNLPLVGPSPVPGLHWATGHYRNGILLAPLAAATLADQLAAGHPDTEEPDPTRSYFHPDSGQNYDRAAEGRA